MFNKETEYALRSLVYIQVQNNKARRPGIAEVATEIEAPLAYTGKILQRLVKQQFILSAKGKGGGFFFDPSSPEVTLLVVVSAIEGDRTFSGCGFGLKACDENNQCPLHHKYAPIRAAIYKLVSEETVQSLARKIESNQNNPLTNVFGANW